MSNVETLDQDATDCELHCPHGITPQEAEAERVHAAILRMNVEQIEHDVRTCELCCPHGVTPEEAEAERRHAAILRAQDDRVEQRRNAAKADLNWSNGEPIGLRPDVVVESPHNHSGGVAWR